MNESTKPEGMPGLPPREPPTYDAKGDLWVARSVYDALYNAAEAILARKTGPDFNAGQNIHADTVAEQYGAKHYCRDDLGLLDVVVKVSDYDALRAQLAAAPGQQNAAPQASPSVAPADSESGSAVGPAGAAPASTPAVEKMVGPGGEDE